VARLGMAGHGLAWHGYYSWWISPLPWPGWARHGMAGLGEARQGTDIYKTRRNGIAWQRNRMWIR
jgi:hypothetical protein